MSACRCVVRVRACQSGADAQAARQAVQEVGGAHVREEADDRLWVTQPEANVSSVPGVA